MSGDDSSPGSAAPGAVTQPGLGLSSFQSSKLQFAEQAADIQTAAGNPPGAIIRQAYEQAKAASASANNSPQSAWQAGNSEDIDTQPPHIMDDHPTQLSQADVFAMMQVAHAKAEAGRVCEAELRQRLSVQE